jgi:hypothetical protein
MTVRAPGWDQEEITRVTYEYFDGDRKILAVEIGADTKVRNWQLRISQEIWGKRIKWLILPLHESETDRHLIGLSG